MPAHSSRAACRVAALLLASPLLGLTPTQAAAQVRAAPLASFEANRPSAGRPAALALAGRRPPTHWKTGALIGGLAGATFGFALGLELCQLSESHDETCAAPVTGALLLGGSGAVIGALIGGAFPKHDS